MNKCECDERYGSVSVYNKKKYSDFIWHCDR